MRLLASLALALLLVVSAVPAMAQDGDDEPGPGREGANSDSQRRGATSVGAFRPVTLGQQNVSGAFVAFSYDQAGVHDLTVGGVRLFDLTVAPPGRPNARIDTDARGALVLVRASNYELRVHDNPQAVTQVDVDTGTVTLALASGGTAQAWGDEGASFTVGNVTGRVRGDDLIVSGSSIVARDHLLVFLDSPRGGFDIKRGDIGKAIAQRHVGAEGSFDEKGSNGETHEDVISYGNVTMRTIRAEHGNVTVQVEGHGTEGRVLVLNIDRKLLGADNAGKLHITLDNATVDHEIDLQALLDPDADGIRPVYHIIFDPASDAFQVLVRVPHYSVHTLSITSTLEIVTPSVVVGVIAGVALLVPSAMLLFRKKRDG